MFRGMWVVAYREMLRFFQERTRMFSSLAMPLLFLVIFGAGFNRIIGTMAQGVNFIQFIYPGIIAMNVLMNSVMSGLSVVWDREFGFLKEILVAPLGRAGIVLGKAAGSAIVAVSQCFIMLILAPFLGVTLSPMLVVKLVPVLILISMSLSGLGVLIASRMRSQQGFQIIVQIVIFPLIFLSGVFFPVNNVPSWLGFISKINPLTYGVDAIRQLFLGPEMGAMGQGGYAIGVTVFGHTMSVLEDLLIVLIFGVILMSAAAWSFIRQE
ncbi:MAG: ABC transporter permease [Dehalococcoidales bacterium]|nr:ABC transporter permease [Dehalococcoidales bacterium]